ncbi:hypothetical protein D9M69_647180 [compost metagenome]
MGLDVGHPAALSRGHGLQCTHLVEDGGFQFLGRQLHGAAAETLQVGEGRVRTQAHAVGQREAHGLAHHDRVARMKTAGDVGAANHLQQRRVVAHAPGAEAFAEVGVEVDGGWVHEVLRVRG